MRMESFHSIDIDVVSCRVIVEAGEEFALDWQIGSSQEITVSEVRDGVLYFQARQRWPAAIHFWRDRNDYVRVTWPSGAQLRDVRAGNISGMVQARGLNAETLELKLTSGRADLSDSSVSRADIRCISGSVHTENCGLGSLNVEAKSGSIRLEHIASNALSCTTISGTIHVSGEPRGLTELKATSGTIAVDSSLPLADHSWKLSSTSGSSRVNGQKAEICERPDAPNQIRARAVSGSISLHFQE